MAAPRRYREAPETAAEKLRRYKQIAAGLISERSSFEAHWDDLAKFQRPRRVRLSRSDRNKGDKRHQSIIDGKALRALRTLAAGLQAGLTSPARPWFKLTTPDPDLADHGPVKTWLHTVEQIMLDAMSRSNIYNAFHTSYGDYGGFGTAAMGVFEDRARGLFAATYPIGSYAGSVDARGRVATFVREFDLTVEQAVEEFGGPDGQPLQPGDEIDWDRFTPAVRLAWDRGNQHTATVTVQQIVMRNRDYRPRALDARALPITSCYYQPDRTDHADGKPVFLRERGFRTMPILMPRWEVTGEDAYGTDCPGMTALGDIRQLQAMVREKGKAIQKMVNPPLTAPSHLRTQAVSLIAGEVTYADLRENTQGVKPIHETRFPVGDLVVDIQDVRLAIDQAYHVDLFLMLARGGSTQPITAEEVRQRQEEKLIVLGPVLERTNDELLDPCIDRLFDILAESGQLPEAPEELQGVNLGVEYVSLMAQAQKLSAVAGQDRFLQSVFGVAQAVPEVLDKLNPDEIVNEYVDILGANPKLVVSDEVANQKRQARVAMQQRMAQAAEMESRAKSTKLLGDTSLEGDSALSRLVGAVA